MVDKKKINFTLFILVVNQIHNLNKQLKLYIFQAPSDSLYKHSVFFFLFLVLQFFGGFSQRIPSLMYSLLSATGLASCPHTKPSLIITPMIFQWRFWSFSKVPPPLPPQPSDIKNSLYWQTQYMWSNVVGTFTQSFTKLALNSLFTPINICCGSRCTNKLTNSEVENWLNIHIWLLQDSY